MSENWGTKSATEALVHLVRGECRSGSGGGGRGRGESAGHVDEGKWWTGYGIYAVRA